MRWCLSLFMAPEPPCTINRRVQVRIWQAPHSSAVVSDNRSFWTADIWRERPRRLNVDQLHQPKLTSCEPRSYQGLKDFRSTTFACTVPLRFPLRGSALAGVRLHHTLLSADSSPGNEYPSDAWPTRLSILGSLVFSHTWQAQPTQA
jgi:hypothetical protein